MASETKLRQWITSKGGRLHPDLVILDANSRPYRSVTAKRKLDKGAEIMRIPIDLCMLATSSTSATLTGLQVRNHGGATRISDVFSDQSQLTPFLALTLQLMHELTQGEQSTNEPYIASLPASHDAVLGWESDERALLQGTSLENEASASGAYEAIVEPIISSHPEVWPGSWGSYATFLRVAGLVQSRAFHLQRDNWLTGSSTSGNDLWLIPAIDQVNHSTDPALRNTTLRRIDAAGASNGHDGSNNPGSYFTMEAERDIAAGEEVLHTYGDLSDAQLLNIYGFIDTLDSGFENPHNKVTLPSGSLLALVQGKSGRRLSKALKRRKAFLKQHKMLPETFTISRANPLPESLISVAQVLFMDDDLFEEVEDLKTSSNPNNLADCLNDLLGKDALDDEEESMLACTTLLRAFDQMLSAYKQRPGQEADAVPAPLRARQARHVFAKEKGIVQLARGELIKLMMSLAERVDNDDDDSE